MKSRTAPLEVRIKKPSTSQAAAPYTQSRPSIRASSASLKLHLILLSLFLPPTPNPLPSGKRALRFAIIGVGVAVT